MDLAFAVLAITFAATVVFVSAVVIAFEFMRDEFHCLFNFEEFAFGLLGFIAFTRLGESGVVYV